MSKMLDARMVSLADKIYNEAVKETPKKEKKGKVVETLKLKGKKYAKKK